MNREALIRATVVTGLTVGALISIVRNPDLAGPLGGALFVLVPATIDAWAFFARLPSKRPLPPKDDAS